jgi:hypothetical protein
MSDTATMNGAEWLARALAGTGMSHVFFVESTLRRTLLHLSDLGVRPILAHSEKARPTWPTAMPASPGGRACPWRNRSGPSCLGSIAW